MRHLSHQIIFCAEACLQRGLSDPATNGCHGILIWFHLSYFRGGATPERLRLVSLRYTNSRQGFALSAALSAELGYHVLLISGEG